MKKLVRRKKRESREISPVRLRVKSLLIERLKHRIFERLGKLRKLVKL